MRHNDLQQYAQRQGSARKNSVNSACQGVALDHFGELFSSTSKVDGRRLEHPLGQQALNCAKYDLREERRIEFAELAGGLAVPEDFVQVSPDFRVMFDDNFLPVLLAGNGTEGENQRDAVVAVLHIKANGRGDVGAKAIARGLLFLNPADDVFVRRFEEFFDALF